MATSNTEFSLRRGALAIYLPTFLFSAAESAIIPVIPVVARDTGATLALAGLVASMLTLGILIGDIPSGLLVARIGERMAMLLSSVLALVGVILGVVANDPFTLGAGILLIGLATATFGLARHALLTTYVPLTYRARALSLLGGMFRAGAVVGPFASAGVIALTGSPHSAFWLTGLGTLGTIAAVYFLTDPEKAFGKPALVTEPDGRVVTRGEDEVEREALGLFRTIWINRGVLARLGTASGITGALRSSRTVLLPLWALSIGMHEVQISLVMGIATAIDFALFYSSGQVMDRWGRRWSAVPSMVIMAISPLILCFTHDLTANVAWFIACAIILSVGNGLASGLILTLGADLAPRGNPAPFLGAFRFTVDAGSSAAPLAITAITAVASISVAAGALGIVGFVGAGMMWRYIPRYIHWKRPASTRGRTASP
jgi:MFS family permease